MLASGRLYLDHFPEATVILSFTQQANLIKVVLLAMYDYVIHML